MFIDMSILKISTNAKRNIKLIVLYIPLLFALLVTLGCGDSSSSPNSAGVVRNGKSLRTIHRGVLCASSKLNIDSPMVTQVQSLVKDGKKVEIGDIICRLSMTDREEKLAKLVGDLTARKIAYEKNRGLAPFAAAVNAAKVALARLETLKKDEEYLAEYEGRSWLKILEEEESQKVNKMELDVLKRRTQAQGRLESKGFGAKVDLMNTEKSLKLIEFDASYSTKLLPWLLDKYDEKQVFKADQARREASNALDLALLEEKTQNLIASAEIGNALEKVEMMASEVRRIESEIASSTIRAEVSGIVVRNKTYTGSGWEKVAEGNNVYPGIPFLSLLNVEKIGVEFHVDQRYSSDITEGWKILFRPDSYPEYLIFGIATQCAVMAVETEIGDPTGERTVEVNALLDKTSPYLVCGFSGTAELFPPSISASDAVPVHKISEKSIVLQKKPLKRELTIPGEVQALQKSYVSPPYNAKLSSVLEDGTKVKKGDSVAQIETSEVEKKLRDSTIQLQNKTEELELLRQKNLVELAKFTRKVTIKSGALQVAKLERDVLMKRRDEDEIINLSKSIGLIESKLKMLSESAALEADLQKRGLKSELDVLAAKLEIAKVKKEKIVTEHKLELEQSGPTRRKIRLAHLAVESAEEDLKLTSIEEAQASFSAFIEQRTLEAEIERITREKMDFESRIKKAEIKSPQDGVVILPEVWKEGDFSKVKVGDQVRGQIPFMHVADMNSLEIRLDVPEMDVKFFKPEKMVKITLKSAVGKTFDGWVSRIGLVAESDIRNRQDCTVEVIISLSPPKGPKTEIDQAFRPGGTCEITTTLYDEKDVVFVPYDFAFPTRMGPMSFGEDGNPFALPLLYSDGLSGYILTDENMTGRKIFAPAVTQ